MAGFGGLSNLDPRDIKRRTSADEFSQDQRTADASGGGKVACSNLSRAVEG